MGNNTHLTFTRNAEVKTETRFRADLNDSNPVTVTYRELRNYIDSFYIGKIYFDRLPEIIEETLRDDLDIYFYNDISDNGEVTLETLLNIIRICQENKMKPAQTIEEEEEIKGRGWLEKDWTTLLEKINLLLSVELIEMEDFIRFEIY